MTRKDIADLINSFGLPWRYHHFDEEDSPQLIPAYIVYNYPGSTGFYADNQRFVPVENVNIRLYTQKKEFEIEEEIEEKLKEANLAYVKSEEWIDSEKLFEILYETEAIYG